ncbi:MAG: HAD family hydrolase [Kiritimatiellia bacterium]
MHNCSHIIWDWNGTLLDDTRACVNSVNKMLVERNLPLLSIERYRDIFGFPVFDFYRKIGFQLEEEDRDAMAVEFHDLMLSDDSIGLQPGVKQTLSALKRRGFTQSVLSASEQSILDAMINDYELAAFFSQITGINNLYGDSKMSMGQRLVEIMGVSSESIVIVGDSLHDYEVAEELNVKCILVSCGHQSHLRLAETGMPVFRSCSDVLDYL